MHQLCFTFENNIVLCVENFYLKWDLFLFLLCFLFMLSSHLIYFWAFQHISFLILQISAFACKRRLINAQCHRKFGCFSFNLSSCSFPVLLLVLQLGQLVLPVPFIPGLWRKRFLIVFFLIFWDVMSVISLFFSRICGWLCIL